MGLGVSSSLVLLLSWNLVPGIQARHTRTGDLRLIDSLSSPSSAVRGGRLEIFLFKKWGTVCSLGFSQTEGDVACQQLGFASAAAVGSANKLGYSPARKNIQIWLDGVNCSSRSDATLLVSCRHNGFGKHSCNHTDDVAVECLRIPTTRIVDMIPTADPLGIAISVGVSLLTFIGIIIPTCTTGVYMKCRNGMRRGRTRSRSESSTSSPRAAPPSFIVSPSTPRGNMNCTAANIPAGSAPSYTALDYPDEPPPPYSSSRSSSPSLCSSGREDYPSLLEPPPPYSEQPGGRPQRETWTPIMRLLRSPTSSSYSIATVGSS